MERFKGMSEAQEVTDEFQVLNEKLKGKSETELTPEEREAEANFERQNLEWFLEGLDKDELMVHAIGRAPMSEIIKDGIYSYYQREKRGIKGGSTPEYQHFGYTRAERTVTAFIEIYKAFHAGAITAESFEQQKGRILSGIREPGRKRYEYFFNNSIPTMLEKLGEPKQEKYYRNSLSAKEPLKDGWRALYEIMSGTDMVSSTPAKDLKIDFLKHKRLLTTAYGSGPSVYFEKPNEKRLYSLISSGGDVGVSNKINPNHFKALRFGLYDADKRALYLNTKYDVQEEEVPLLQSLQKKGIKFFDQTMMGIPPLDSISIKALPEWDEQLKASPYYNQLGVNKANAHPSFAKNLKGLVEQAGLSTADVENHEVMELIANNQKKSLALIEEISKEKGYDWGQDVHGDFKREESTFTA